MQKLNDADFKQKEDAMTLSSYFLQQSVTAETMKAKNPKFKPLKIEDRDLKRIAVKLADYLLVQTNINKLWSLSQLIPMVEKYAPEKAVLLNQKEAEMKKLVPVEWQSWQEANKLISDPNTTPEKLISEAENFAGYEKFQLYQAAVDRAIVAGTGDKIRQALQNLPDDKQRNDALDYLDSKISEKAIKDDKLDEVQKIVAKSTSDSSKIKLLVNLAVGYQKKNTEESRKTAQSLMAEARKLVGDIPESREEANDILKIAAGYAEINSDKAFPLLNPLTDMTNDTLTAYALLSKYNKSESMFRQGELIFTQTLAFGGTHLQYGKELKRLAEAHIGKVKILIEQLRRDDVRVLMRMLLAESVIKERIAVEGVQPFYGYDDF